MHRLYPCSLTRWTPVQTKNGKDPIQIDSVEFEIHSHFDISLLIKPGERTSLHLIGQTEKLDDRSCEVILKRYSQVLAMLSDASCTTVPVLRERWNQREQDSVEAGSSVVFSPYQKMHDWILDITNRHATNVALVQGGRSLSYAELQHKAQQVSQALDLMVDGHDRPIAISLASGIDTIIVMMGVLISGRFYLPLDHQQPVQRQALLCQDADCAVVIAEYETMLLVTRL